MSGQKQYSDKTKSRRKAVEKPIRKDGNGTEQHAAGV
jgi:hypothetical protein